MELPLFKFDEKRFLENLLLDESREAYASLTKEQKAIIRHAYSLGFLEAKQNSPNMFQ